MPDADPRSPPRAVVFDAYGTLLDLEAAIRPHAARLGPHAAAVSARWRQRQLEATWVRSLAGGHEDFWAITARTLREALAAHGLGDPALEADLLAAYRALGAYPGAAGVLAALREAGLATAILSNGTGAMLDGAVAAAGLGPLLDHVLSAEALPVFKPDPRVYALATAALGLEAGRIAFVSGNAWDAYGAARAGLRVFWLNRAGGPAEYGLDALATVLPDLGALPAALAAGRAP